MSKDKAMIAVPMYSDAEVLAARRAMNARARAIQRSLMNARAIQRSLMNAATHRWAAANKSDPFALAVALAHVHNDVAAWRHPDTGERAHYDARPQVVTRSYELNGQQVEYQAVEWGGHACGERRRFEPQRRAARSVPKNARGGTIWQGEEAMTRRWWLVNVALCGVLTWLWQWGLVVPLFEKDSSYLSFVIAAAGTLGVLCAARGNWRRVEELRDDVVFLGLLGTVIGFAQAVSGIKPGSFSDPTQAPAMVATFVQGAQTALYTTIVGAVASLWLRANEALVRR